MIELLYAGGLYFTIPLTLLGVSVLGAGVTGVAQVWARGHPPEFWRRTLFHLCLFSFVFGILGQGIGLYQAMIAIEAMGGVSPALLAGGLKVSMIAPLYGLLIFLTALVFRFGIDARARGAMNRVA